jgi:hypothetical protein
MVAPMNTPAIASEHTAKSHAPLVPGSRVGSLAMRILFALCGVGLVVGFFMRWMTIGQIVSVSGFTLMMTQGEAVDLLSGGNRWLLFVVPVFGVLLLLGAFTGRRFALWAGLLCGMFVLGFGFFAVVRAFFQTTGLGMWVVVLSAFLAFGMSLIGLGRAGK